MFPWSEKLLAGLKSQSHLEFIDKLNGVYTALLLLAFSALVSTKQLLGSPIQCWTPAEFPSAWTSYAETYCLVEGTHYSPIRKNASRKDSSSTPVSYYQWIPFVLVVQAMLFLSPGVLVQPNLKTFGKLEKSELAGYFHHRVIHDRPLTITVLYLLRKLLYLLNVSCQIILINAFFGNGWSEQLWGWETILKHVFEGKTWHTTGIFPRVAFCTFSVRVLGNVQDYTLQCLLAVNMLNEKIYIILWLWFLLLMVVGVFDLLRTFLNLLYSKRREHVKRLLGGDTNEATAITSFLGTDGWLMLRYIEHITDEVTACKVLKGL